MRALLVTLTLLLLAGCDRQTILYYEFQSDLVEAEYGTLGAAISGEFTNTGRSPEVMQFGNPYTLRISFNPTSEQYLPHAIGNITIRSANGEILYRFEGGEMESTWLDYSEDWYSSWTQHDLGLEHEVLTPGFQLTFIVDGKEVKKGYDFSFVPVYGESHHNNYHAIWLDKNQPKVTPTQIRYGTIFSMFISSWPVT